MVNTITDSLLKTKTDIPLEIRVAVLETLYEIKYQFREDFEKGRIEDPNIRCGTMVVVGFDKQDKKYAISNGEDLVGAGNYAEMDFNRLGPNIFSSEAYEIIKKATQIDGAILMNLEGYLLATGYIINVSPNNIANRMKLPNHRPLWQRFGFNEEVGTKHTSAIAGSHVMPTTLIYTLSEQVIYPKIRVFQEGKIIASPYRREIETSSRREISSINFNLETHIPIAYKYKVGIA